MRLEQIKKIGEEKRWPGLEQIMSFFNCGPVYDEDEEDLIAHFEAPDRFQSYQPIETPQMSMLQRVSTFEVETRGQRGENSKN